MDGRYHSSRLRASSPYCAATQQPKEGVTVNTVHAKLGRRNHRTPAVGEWTKICCLHVSEDHPASNGMQHGGQCSIGGRKHLHSCGHELHCHRQHNNPPGPAGPLPDCVIPDAVTIAVVRLCMAGLLSAASAAGSAKGRRKDRERENMLPTDMCRDVSAANQFRLSGSLSNGHLIALD